ALVTGNGSYAFIASPGGTGTGSWGHLLLVVYEWSGAPLRRIALAFGGDSMQYASSETTLTGFQAGAATLELFTEADQRDYSAGEESIRVDGAIVAGGMERDLFCNNQGYATSYFELPVVLHGSSARIGVVTGEDWLGWHMALLMQAAARTLCVNLAV